MATTDIIVRIVAKAIVKPVTTLMGPVKVIVLLDGKVKTVLKVRQPVSVCLFGSLVFNSFYL